MFKTNLIWDPMCCVYSGGLYIFILVGYLYSGGLYVLMGYFSSGGLCSLLLSLSLSRSLLLFLALSLSREDILASTTCWSCSSCCSLVCSLTCSCCLAIVIALSRLRSVINCSFCFTAWSLTPITKRSLTISLVSSLYSQCTASVCSSLANYSTL